MRIPRGRQAVTSAAAASSIFAIALLIRLLAVNAAPYGDEAVHYSIARTMGFGETGIHLFGSGASFKLYLLMMSRPVFFLLYWPFAAISFVAFKVWTSLLSSLVAVLVYVLARRLAANPFLAAAAGLGFAVNPAMVIWGSRAFPDTAMTGLVFVALIVLSHGRRTAASILLLLASWAKEVAVLVPAFLLALYLLETLREKKLAAGTIAMSVVTMLGVLPMVISALISGVWPGWGRGGPTWGIIELCLLTAWLVPLVLVGFTRRSLRFVCAMAALYPAFYLARRVLSGGGFDGWYAVLPAALALTCFAAVGSTLLREWPPFSPHRRLALGAIGLVVVALFAPVVFSAPGLADLAAPLGTSAESTWGAVGLVHSENQSLPTLTEFLAHHQGAYEVVDVGWFYWDYPVSAAAGRNITVVFSTFLGDHPMSNATLQHELAAQQWLLVEKHDSPSNAEIRDAHRGCIAFENPAFVVYELVNCARP